jgi:putative heme-binding domain-containing protein
MPLTLCALLLLATVASASAQNATAQTDDATAVAAGGAMFRERCADCHGTDAKGGRGPDLTRIWADQNSDQRVFQIIKSGIPGSIMPPSTAPDTELRAIVAYLRNISTAKAEASRGDAERGQQVFATNCASCHRINGHGGSLGPDLSRVAASQSNQVLTRAIRDASASFTSGFEPVTLVHRDNRRTRGTRKGEDPFSIQIMDVKGRLQGYLKSDLRDVIRDEKSLMPDFAPDRLSDSALDDLLAYLARYRVNEPPRRPAPAGDRD